MSIIGRHIASLYMKIFCVCIASFMAIYLVIDFLEKIRHFSEKQAAATDVALFFLYKIPEIVTQVAPLAVLMATLLSLGMLSRTSEIIAMRSCGMSLPEIARPILVTSFCISIAVIFVNEFILPASYQSMRYVEEVSINRNNLNTFFRENNIWYREGNYILQAKLFNPQQQRLYGVTLWQFVEGMTPTKRMDAETAENVGTGWLLKNVVSRGMGGGNVMQTATLPQTQAYINLKLTDLKVLDKSADNMGFMQLMRYAQKLQKGGYDATPYLVLKHSKLSLPFASFIMAFLGIPFAMRGGRSSGVALGIGFSLGIGFTYFVLNAILLSLGQTGILPPLVAAWSANLIFAMTGAWLSMTVNL